MVKHFYNIKKSIFHCLNIEYVWAKKAKTKMFMLLGTLKKVYEQSFHKWVVIIGKRKFISGKCQEFLKSLI